MIFKTAELAREVRVALDQNMASGQLIADGDIETLSLNALILSKLEEAARRVESAAPVELLEAGHNFGDAVYWNETPRMEGTGWILLPADFMRLTAFRMSDWERTLYGAITPADPLYARQSSRYGGIRGNPQKPVAAIVSRQEGKALEFYSCRSRDAYAATATYRPYPKTDENGGIDISERCERAVVYTAAALTLSAYGEGERASALLELANTLTQT